MTRKEMWSLYGLLVADGYHNAASQLQKGWNNNALLIHGTWVADIDPTPWVELHKLGVPHGEEAAGEGP